MASLAEDVCRRYPGLNQDLLIAGALLHDVGKIAELSYQRSFDYTDDGKLLGHIVIGVEMIEARLRQLPDFPRPLATLLKHLLLSHHGQYEYGSPKRPKTLEAVILNFIDDLDSKINGVRTHIEQRAQTANRPGPATIDSTTAISSRVLRAERQPAPVRDAAQPPTAPPPAAAKAGAPPATIGCSRPPAPLRLHSRRQLQGKSLDLFAAADDEEE